MEVRSRFAWLANSFPALTPAILAKWLIAAPRERSVQIKCEIIVSAGRDFGGHIRLLRVQVFLRYVINQTTGGQQVFF